MADQEYFKHALANFTFDVASGGAIRHLADRGYTADEIRKKLDFPTPYERIQQTIWKHYLDTGVLLIEEPGSGKQQETCSYITEYDSFGRKSFRRVTAIEAWGEKIEWKERQFDQALDGRISVFLLKQCAENGEDTAYVSCDIGLRSRRDPEHFGRLLELLEPRQREYILGIPWERKLVYHRLNQQMREITARLYECGEYQGDGYFGSMKEKIHFKKRKESAWPQTHG